MKLLTMVLPLLLLLTLPAMGAGLPNDKVMHFGASVALSTAGFISLRRSGLTRTESAGYAVLLSLSLGLAKELTDSQFSGHDMLANAAGSLIGGYSASMVFRF